jgi:glycosyltransferase involved in cell wall biosynthesis
MKLLIVSHSIPYPLINGGNVAQFSMLSYLQNHIAIDYCCVVWNTGQPEKIDILKSKLPKINFIVFNQIAEGNNKSISVYARIYKKIIKKLSLKKTRNKIEDHDDLKHNPGSIINVKNEEYIVELQKLLSRDCWDIIQTEFFEMIELGRLFPKKAKTIFVSHESKTLRMISAKANSKANDWYKEYLIHLNRQIEVTLLKEYDKVVVFSEEDKNRLKDFGVENIEVSPFSVMSNQEDTVVSDHYNK